ncbi:hypothetical protein A4D02_00260 [Niastella koreensis]|uniref:RDD domain containing protein n=2 Tax=Niastella koreensis TaxID=354356 RepID=G8TA48_NIAKG|nr:RDD family protein [Niastella koreensis]AEW02420.1 RDD domain containing protein [Niastella koreensis GR20-10]OQP54797.1 hypothetical protein A4D02_00260 [Niastella koreensis]
MDYQDQTDLLQEEQNELGYVDPAGRGLRLANYLIDQIVLMVLINIITVAWTVIAKATGGVDPQKYLGADAVMTLNMNVLLVRAAMSLLITMIYYTVCETAMNGRTIGKLSTNTIAITQDGTPFTFKHALVRSICRAIPFELFSGLGYMPWHDSISKTAVVRKTW